jgi:hypothetical protein
MVVLGKAKSTESKNRLKQRHRVQRFLAIPLCKHFWVQSCHLGRQRKTTSGRILMGLCHEKIEQSRNRELHELIVIPKQS